MQVLGEAKTRHARYVILNNGFLPLEVPMYRVTPADPLAKLLCYIKESWQLPVEAAHFVQFRRRYQLYYPCEWQTLDIVPLHRNKYPFGGEEQQLVQRFYLYRYLFGLNNLIYCKFGYAQQGEYLAGIYSMRETLPFGLGTKIFRDRKGRMTPGIHRKWFGWEPLSAVFRRYWPYASDKQTFLEQLYYWLVTLLETFTNEEQEKYGNLPMLVYLRGQDLLCM